MTGQSQLATGRNGAPVKCVVYHDYFAIRGGGERLALTLAQALRAELVYGFRTAESYQEALFPANSRALGGDRILPVRGLRLLSLVAGFAREQRDAKSYNIRIFSGVTAPFAAPTKKAGGVNIFYCHTPPRFLFDQRKHFLATLPSAGRIFAQPFLWGFEASYRRMIARMDVIVANSENTRRRIATYLGRDSVVIHPPVETDRFVFAEQDGYYLSTARLTALKRVDAIVEAFRLMPDKKLVVASGGEDLQKLKSIAAGAENIKFAGWMDDAALRRLIGSAIATLYLPVDEDFGMSPVESMAAGKPVIGVAEGGLLETIEPGQTGVLLPSNFTISDIVAAVRELTPERALAMRSTCTQHASRFSRENFVSKITALIADQHGRG